MLLATSLGVLVGAFSGYFGGFAYALMMRVTGVLLAVPALLLAPLAARIFAADNPFYIAMIFGFLSWQSIARIVRSQFLSLREMQFTESANCISRSDRNWLRTIRAMDCQLRKPKIIAM